jgi:hypothetical protein
VSGRGLESVRDAQDLTVPECAGEDGQTDRQMFNESHGHSDMRIATNGWRASGTPLAIVATHPIDEPCGAGSGCNECVKSMCAERSIHTVACGQFQ